MTSYPLTLEQVDLLKKIHDRWHNGEPGRTLHQATFDIGYLSGIIALLEEQLENENPRA